MNRLFLSAALAVSLVALSSAQVTAAMKGIRLPIPEAKNETYPGYVKVKYRPDVADRLERRQLASSSASASLISNIEGTGWTLWSYPSILKYETVQAQFKSDPNVLSVEPLNRVYPLWTDPNDLDWGADETSEDFILDFGENSLSFKRLWHLDDVGAQAGWSKWPNQWYTSANKPGGAAILAIIDTGCDMGHPDFMNAGGTDTSTTAGGQLYKGRSKYFSFGAVAGTNANDQNGHGTHVTGLAIAAGNNGGYNGHGVIGTGYGARAMILKVFDSNNNASDFDAAAAMYYAADQHAVVINMSLGTTNFSQMFQDAATYCWQKGTLIVAAGNESGEGGGDLGPIYPAGCSGVLGVSANGPNMNWASSYSGIGMFVDIAAPGGDVIQGEDYIIIQYDFSTSMRTRGYLEELSDAGAIYPPYTRDYSYLVGTSMASPVVAGAAINYAGYKNWKQGMWHNVSIYQNLEKTAYPYMGAAHGGWEPYQGFGCLDMDALMNGYNHPADGGGFEGIVYSNGTPTANVAVRARKVTSAGTLTGLTFSTTTNQHGIYRFDPLAPGTYEVWAAPNGLLKTKRIQLIAGCDITGTDFWGGTYTGDSTGPVISKFLVTKGRLNKVTMTHWVYDPETSIDRIQYRVGTTSGGSEVMGNLDIYTRTSGLTLTVPSNLTPGTTYFVTATITNGAGMTTSQTVSFVASA